MTAGLVTDQVTLFPTTGQTGARPIPDLEVPENRTLDGHTQELVRRPALGR